eukprot:108495-Chlamydomonas_euryale.AAC.1
MAPGAGDGLEPASALAQAGVTRYRCIRMIGVGSYGTVYAAEVVDPATGAPTDDTVAIKFLNLDKATRHMEREIINHSRWARDDGACAWIQSMRMDIPHAHGHSPCTRSGRLSSTAGVGA